LTAITARAAKQSGVMAVFWPEAKLILSPRSSQAWPRRLNRHRHCASTSGLISVRSGMKTGLFTTGLAPLVHMEIEIPGIDMEIGEFREWLLESCATRWRTVRFWWTGKPSGGQRAANPYPALSVELWTSG
jgi:hypothetical protein